MTLSPMATWLGLLRLARRGSCGVDAGGAGGGGAGFGERRAAAARGRVGFDASGSERSDGWPAIQIATGGCGGGDAGGGASTSSNTGNKLRLIRDLKRGSSFSNTTSISILTQSRASRETRLSASFTPPALPPALLHHTRVATHNHLHLDSLPPAQPHRTLPVRIAQS